MFLNMPGLLISLSKSKYGRLSLKYALICLKKYNLTDIMKFLKKLLWKCLIWYYEYTLVSEYAL